MSNLNLGDKVQVTHDGGVEFGILESINYKSGKALVAFSVDSFYSESVGKTVTVNNLCGFNISQIKAVA
jgi:hypothetical protein